MKTFNKTAAQGEIDITKLNELPPLSTLQKVEPINGVYVIGHSETGHHHVLERDCVEAVYSGKNAEGMECLYALLKSDGELKHLRSFDTHESIGFNAGDIVEFISGNEYDPYAELARKQAD